jgi:hypothetical protein
VTDLSPASNMTKARLDQIAQSIGRHAQGFEFELFAEVIYLRQVLKDIAELALHGEGPLAAIPDKGEDLKLVGHHAEQHLRS